MNALDIKWEDILVEPFVGLILGARGEGKTALAHRLLDEFEDSERDAYIMGFPEHKRDLLPDHIDILPVDTSKEQWPEDSIVLIHEAHQLLHARRSQDAENLELDKLVTISRHKNSDILYDTQQSHRLDKNAVAAVDAIICRWPALMQEEFERRAIKPIIRDARDALSDYVNVHDEDDFTFVEREETPEGVDRLKKHVYVHADQFRGEYPHPIDLADHWTEEISKAYAGTSEDNSGAYGDGINSLAEAREHMADPDDLDDKSMDEVAQAMESAGVEMEQEPEPTGDVDDDAEYTQEQLAKGQELIRQAKEQGDRTFGNEADIAMVEFIIPRNMEEEFEAMLEDHLIRPQGAGAFAQEPMISDRYPDAAEGLTGYQIKLEDRQELDSAAYDLPKLFDALEDEPVVASVSPSVEVSLPW